MTTPQKKKIPQVFPTHVSAPEANLPRLLRHLQSRQFQGWLQGKTFASLACQIRWTNPPPTLMELANNTRSSGIVAAKIYYYRYIMAEPIFFCQRLLGKGLNIYWWFSLRFCFKDVQLKQHFAFLITPWLRMYTMHFADVAKDVNFGHISKRPWGITWWWLAVRLSTRWTATKYKYGYNSTFREL